MNPILIISALDSSGAAGLAVDIRTAHAHRQSLRCAATALTVQDDLGVRAVYPAPASSLAESILAAAAQPPGLGAVKIGAVPSAECARAISESIGFAQKDRVPVVLDPVLAATSGEAFMEPAAYLDWIRAIAPFCSLVTPNSAELAAMTGNLADAVREEDRATLLRNLGFDAVLITGGNSRGARCVDRLYTGDGPPLLLTHDRISGGNVRGTGCALSTAIACRLARGVPLRRAARDAVSWIQGRILRARRLGNHRLLFP